jgi:uncharacterized oxidoreductase
MLHLSPAELHDTATKIFRAAGADPEPTKILVDHLIAADLAGHNSHGVIRIPAYVRQIKSGQVQPNARPSILRETVVSVLVDGAWAFGQVSADYGTKVAIARAKEQGIAAVGIVRCNHIGRVGTYASMASREGVVAIVTIGDTGESAVPYGGKRPIFGTNPFAIGFPAAERDDLLVDFATTTVAAGKIQVARAKHEQLPPGSLIDKDGNPTNDPLMYRDGGSLLPFGGHKGYGLAVTSVLLSNILIGAAEIGPEKSLSGAFIIAIDAGLFRDRSKVEADADALFGRIKEVPPAPGFSEVLIPGEPEVRSAERAGQEGIPVAEDTWAAIVEAGKSVGAAV